MDTNDLVRHFGDKPSAMEALEIYRQVWEYWENKGIPEGWQYKIQVLTGGKLKAAAATQRA